jgi:hypothetical protein
MAFSKLLTTPLTTTHVEVLATIKGKYFMQYPHPIKSDINTRNPNNSFSPRPQSWYWRMSCLEKEDKKIDYQRSSLIFC